MNNLTNRWVALTSISVIAMTSAILLSYQAIAATDIPLDELGVSIPVQPNMLFVLDDSGSMVQSVTLAENNYTLNSYLDSNKTALVQQGYHTSDVICPRRRYYFAHRSYTDEPERDVCGSAPKLFNEYVFQHKEYSKIFTALDWRLNSSSFDYSYYNPQINYVALNGHPEQNFFGAADSAQSSDTPAVDLSQINFKYAIWEDSAGWTPTADGSLKQSQINSAPNGLVDIWDNFEEIYFNGTDITISRTTFNPTPNAVDCRPDTDSADYRADILNCFNGSQGAPQPWDDRYGRTADEERTNIANWFTYYRNRKAMLTSIINNIVNNFPSFRFGVTYFNDVSDPYRLFIPPVKDYDEAAHNKKLVSNIVKLDLLEASRTPTSEGLERALNHFGDTDISKNPIIEACQQNFALVLSDGRESSSSSAKQITSDIDGDGEAGTFADIARYAYQTDLRPDMIDIVPPTKTACPGEPLVSHQHMRTLSLTFGFGPDLLPDDNQCWPKPKLSIDSNWGDRRSASNMWHGAYNSAGQMLLAKDPSSIISDLNRVLGVIDLGVRSAAAGSVTAARLQSNTFFYTSQYDLDKLEGDLKSYEVDLSGTNRQGSTVVWSAAEMLAQQKYTAAKRRIFTYNPESNVAQLITPDRDLKDVFSKSQIKRVFSNVSPPSKANIQAAYVDFATDLHASGLGTLIHSNPIAVGAPTRTYPTTMPYIDEYLTFKEVQQDRRTMIYVGSNSGLLHGFDAATGREVFAYAPDLVLSESMRTADTGLNYRVNGPITVTDAYLSSQQGWRSVLVSGLRQGGAGYAALDVTDPESFIDGAITSKVLWEYQGDDDLGLSYPAAAIGLMANGKWAAVLGNGYNSVSGEGVLIVVDLKSGDVIRKIHTGHDGADDPTGRNRKNGLAEPGLVDTNNDGIIDRIYVGDYFGNLFRINVESTDPDQWASEFGSDTFATPLYSTKGAAFTSKPSVLSHPKEGFIVIAGSGQLIAPGDTTEISAMLGLYDQDAPINGDSRMVQHSMMASSEGVVITTGTAIDNSTGWRIELAGELIDGNIVNNPKVQTGQITFLVATEIENGGACDRPIERSSLITLNAFTGDSTMAPTYLNDENAPIKIGDKYVDGIVSGKRYLDTVLLGDGSTEVFVSNTSDGKQEVIRKVPPDQANGRRYWMRIKP